MAEIVVEGLTKTYQVAERAPGLWGAVAGLARRQVREVRALDGVDFHIEAGQLVGYIGPNGAGKSTTVKVLSGILFPDSGRCTVGGRVPWLDRVAHVARIGVVFGQRTQLWWDLPVEESFQLLRDVYRVDPVQHAAARDELVEGLDLAALLATPARQLSLGQRMRCDLAAALLHQPEVVFLDEPTLGLDAPAKLAVREYVRRRNHDHGTTVILTTHDLDDVEALCDRVMVIGRGRVLADGDLEGLRARAGVGRRLVVDLAGDPDPEALELEGAEVLEVRGARVTWAFDPASTPAPALIAAVAARHPVRDLFVEAPPVEEVVARLYDALLLEEGQG